VARGDLAAVCIGGAGAVGRDRPLAALDALLTVPAGVVPTGGADVGPAGGGVPAVAGSHQAGVARGRAGCLGQHVLEARGAGHAGHGVVGGVKGPVEVLGAEGCLGGAQSGVGDGCEARLDVCGSWFVLGGRVLHAWVEVMRMFWSVRR